MVVTYQEHRDMWSSPAALKQVIRKHAVALHKRGNEQELSELYHLYRRYCLSAVALDKGVIPSMMSLPVVSYAFPPRSVGTPRLDHMQSI
jgi:hypothetical protein